MQSPILELKRVSLAAPVGIDYLLRDISFQVEQTEKIAIVGASGSGKTSLLRLLNRLVSPVEGEIYFQDKPYEKYEPNRLRRQIMLVPQEPKLLGMTGKEALIYALQLQQIERTKISELLTKYCDALQIPQIWLEKTELQLSLGQRQLITIARALMLEPKIILLDEPTSALDKGICDRLLTVLDNLNRERQTTIFMVNHQLEICQQFAKRIVYLNSGKITENILATDQNWQKIELKIKQETKTLEQEW